MLSLHPLTKTGRLAPDLKSEFGIEMDCKSHALANIAQLVEQLICNQPVGGSSPSVGSVLGLFCARHRAAKKRSTGGAPQLERRAGL